VALWVTLALLYW